MFIPPPVKIREHFSKKNVPSRFVNPLERSGGLENRRGSRLFRVRRNERPHGLCRKKLHGFRRPLTKSCIVIRQYF